MKCYDDADDRQDGPCDCSDSCGVVTGCLPPGPGFVHLLFAPTYGGGREPDRVHPSAEPAADDESAGRDQTNDRHWVLPANTAVRLRTWRRHAATRLAILGLAPLSALPRPPRHIPLEPVHGSLGDPEEVRFAAGWVWRVTSRGRIPRLVRTLLLAGPQTPDTIAAGLRDQRMTVPPVPVLAAWRNTVTWARPTTTGRYTTRYRDTAELGKWDRALDHARAGKPLTTAALAAALQLDRNHLGATLRRSILLEHASYGHWRLRRANRRPAQR